MVVWKLFPESENIYDYMFIYFYGTLQKRFSFTYES